jgi:hypothetical protein
MLKIFKQYFPVRNILFVIGEGLCIFGSVLIASSLLLGAQELSVDPWLYLKALLITAVCQLCLYYNDLYDLKITDSYSELGIRLLQALGFASIILACIYFIFSKAIIGEGIYVISICFVLLFIISWRFGYTLILRSGLFDEKIILIGSGELAEKISHEISDKKDCGYTVLSRVVETSDNIDPKDGEDEGVIFKKDYDGLCDMSRHLDIKKIVVALKQKRGAFPIKELLECRVEGIDIVKGNDFYELLSGKLIVDQINPTWLIYSEGFRKSGTMRFLKRVIDLILSFVILVLLTPLIIITAVLIKIDSRGPIIFLQDRVGEKGKIFNVRKFRSMVADAEKLSGPVWATDKDE